MNRPPEFLTKGFPPFTAKMFCEKEQNTTTHILEFVASTENHVSHYKTCIACKEAYSKLLGLGVDIEDPRKADVMPLTEYVFLVLHPEDAIA